MKYITENYSQKRTLKKMTDKSYVTLEQHQCLVCGDVFDTGSLLLDKQLMNKFESKTVTDRALCPKHKKVYDDNYIALIEINPPSRKSDHIDFESASRTGEVAFVRKPSYVKLFGPVGDKKDFKDAIVFVEKGIIAKLQEMVEDND